MCCAAPEVTTQEIEAAGGKWVRATDGRLIEYFVSGQVDGVPMYYQHSFGQTGFQASCPDFIAAATSLGLKVIAPTMPTFGLSSGMKGGAIRKLRDWPADVKLVLEAENAFDKFYVSAYSAGCVHAAVVAHAFAEHVLGISLFSPTTTLAEEQAMGAACSVVFLRKTLGTPCVGHALSYLMGSCMDGEKRIAAAPDCMQAIQDSRKQPEGSYMRRRLEFILKDGDRAASKTWLGWTANVHVLNEEMPFAPEELKVLTKTHGVPFIVSSSPDDRTNPPGMQQWWAKKVEGLQLVDRPEGWGHCHFFAEGCNQEIWEMMMGKRAKASV